MNLSKKILLSEGECFIDGKFVKASIVINENIIEDIIYDQNIDHSEYSKIIDCRDKIISPGLIDMHVHLRYPGQEEKESMHTGCQAAARGGFTTVACMPNTNPTIDNVEIYNQVKLKAKEVGLLRVLPVPSMTYSLKGESVADFKLYREVGAFAVTDDGRGVQDNIVMEKVFIEAKKNGLSVLQHCEFDELSNGGVINKGEVSKKLGLKGIPKDSETKMIERDLELLRKVGGHYHAQHISCGKSVELIRLAKKEGLSVSAEVTPHHLTLSDSDITTTDSNYKMNPPLREVSDKDALIAGLKDGTIDIIATDHAPHSKKDKVKEISKASFGIIGLEFAFPLLYTHLVKENKLPLEVLFSRFTSDVSDLFNFNFGKIKKGFPADLTVINLDNYFVIALNSLKSKGKNSPFNGEKLFGWPEYTFYSGKVTWKDCI